MMKVLYNQIGYEPEGERRIILETEAPLPETPRAELLREDGEDTGIGGDMASRGKVPGWTGRFYYDWEFPVPPCLPGGTGRYRLRVSAGRRSILTDSFEIRRGLYADLLTGDILAYFRSVRCGDEFERQDRSVPFEGDRPGTADVRGGWYDASGDKSKYLSHLSYANYMNPQQTPAVVWLMAEGLGTLREERPALAEDRESLFVRELLHGADFLVRMQDPAGYFYMTVFDRWTGEPAERRICSYSTQAGHCDTSWQAGFRQGGGMAAAALARAAGLNRAGAFSPREYLAAAERGFAHLQEHNLSYLDDRRENIIDDYCALLAASELYAATKNLQYLEAADQRAENLMNRLSDNGCCGGWWRADDAGEIPYFHAAEAGLPVLSLLRYAETAGGRCDRDRISRAVSRSLSFELAVTREVNNPFSYPRQYVKPLKRARKTAFFFPHSNPSGYWWQGENARLASLAMAARKSIGYLSDRQLQRSLKRYADSLVHWILGRNPFDVCMLTGRGRNNPEGEPGDLNYPGGVINGITADPENEEDIAFLPEGYRDDGMHRWRWCEQWIPHAAWLLGAVCSGHGNEGPVK